MARRFSGPFSPRPSGAPLRPKPTPAPRAGARAFVFGLLPLPFLARAFLGETGFFPAISAAGLLIAAAWMTREGVIAAASHEARRLARLPSRAPALPRKALGSLLTGLAFATGAAAWETRPLALAGMGLIAGLLHLASFGRDPRPEPTSDADPFQTERAARLIAEAEARITALLAQAQRSQSPRLAEQTEGFAATARALLAQLEADPGAVSSLRAYLTAYLQGAHDALAKLADLLAQGPNPAAEEACRALIADLDTAFDQRRQKLIAHDQTGLDIEIEVLRERLKLNA